jgi:hypothetical protein
LRGNMHHLTAIYGAWLSDEKALKDVASCKGSFLLEAHVGVHLFSGSSCFGNSRPAGRRPAVGPILRFPRIPPGSSIFGPLTPQRCLKSQRVSRVSGQGASGTKCCVNCQNIIGRGRPRAGDNYLKHFSHTDPADFDLHTPESLTALAIEMETRLPLLSDGDFKLLQQCAGIVCAFGYLKHKAGGLNAEPS